LSEIQSKKGILAREDKLRFGIDDGGVIVRLPNDYAILS